MTTEGSSPGIQNEQLPPVPAPCKANSGETAGNNFCVGDRSERFFLRRYVCVSGQWLLLFAVATLTLHRRHDRCPHVFSSG